jgi:hypothetical protein
VASVKAELDGRLSASEVTSIRGKEDAKKGLEGRVEAVGVPASFVVEVKEIDPNVTLPGGAKLSIQKSASPLNSWMYGLYGPGLEAALKGTPVVNANRGSYVQVPLFAVDAKTYAKFLDEPVTLKADVEFLVSRYAVVAEMPLVKGARFDRGSEHVVITDVLRQPDRVDILLHRRAVHLMFDRNNAGMPAAERVFANMKAVYLLWNKKRNEAVAQKRQPSFPFSVFSQASRLVNEPLNLAFGVSVRQKPSIP